MEQRDINEIILLLEKIAGSLEVLENCVQHGRLYVATP